MTWKDTCPVLERRKFIAAWRRDGNVSGLAETFQISRKTAYKWIARFVSEGGPGLEDRSRRPRSSPGKTCDKAETSLCQLREHHPTWGPKKLVAKLSVTCPDLALPAVSTAGDILARHGLVQPRGNRRRQWMKGAAWPWGGHPNAIWAIDYKGEFKLGNGQYCYPLTVSDEHSRYLLLCQGFSRICGASVIASCRDLFRRHGLPEAIRSDNGSPFASTGLARLSRPSVWWLRLGIALKRTMPGHPEQNGRHERMHRDMKAQTTRPPERHLRAQQSRFDAFQAEHNHERPHEALGQKLPAHLYQPSPRSYPERLPDLEYPSHFEVRKVGDNGCIKLWNKDIFLSTALRGEMVGVAETDDDRWTVSLGAFRLGVIDRRTRKIDEPPPIKADEPIPTLDALSP